MQSRELGAMKVRLLLRSSFLLLREMGRGVHIERQRQKGAACVCVEWCVHVLY